MNKRNIIQEIKELNNRERFLAGHRVCRLPVHKGGLINKGTPRDELPIVYTNPQYSTDLNSLTKRTKKNALDLKENFDIDWFFIVKYVVEKEHEHQVQRHAWMVYGIWNGALVNLYRKETVNVAAGSSNLYFGYGNRVQIYKLVNLAWPSDKYSTTDIKSWINSIKRLNKIVNHVELQKIVLLHA